MHPMDAEEDTALEEDALEEAPAEAREDVEIMYEERQRDFLDLAPEISPEPVPGRLWNL